MKNLPNEKPCKQCGITKPTEDFRKDKLICRSCETINDRQRCSGDRICTNCRIFKLEKEFDKYSRHCKDCKSKNSKNKLVVLRDNSDQTEYNKHLKRNSKNNVKRHRKREEKFDNIPIENCYKEYLNILRKNANSRATKAEISCDIDLDFLVNMYNNQNGKCALTKLPFNLKKYGTKRAFAPSIDRIDCQKGYTKDNIRLVCLIVNIALNDFGDEAFDIMCQAYSANKIS